MDGAVVRRFAPQAPEVGAARGFLRETFATWGVTRCEDAELVVSELVTNAIRHGDGAPLVRLEQRPDRVRIEVEDESDRPPVGRSPGHEEPSGRGLAIVGALALGWGHERRAGGGKTVWAEVPLR